MYIIIIVIVNFSNIFVTSSHSSNNFKYFQYNNIVFLREKNSYISPNIIKDLLFYGITEVVLAIEGNYNF